MALFGSKLGNTDLNKIGMIAAPEGMPQQPQRKGLFGNRTFQDIAGVLGDILTTQGGGEAMYMPMRLKERQRIYDAEAAQAERQTKFEDWQKQEQWKRDNPMPAAPNDTERDYQFMVQTIGKEGADNWLRSRGDPLVNVTLPNGQFYSGPQSGLRTALMGAASGPATAPTAPVGKLTPMGGSQQGTVPFANPPMRLPGGVMTSGRRTPEGNRIVGGVSDSKHLTGEAADYAGPDLNALLEQARKLPGLRRAFIHNGNHVHTEGNWNVPYHGKNGTRGR